MEISNDIKRYMDKAGTIIAKWPAKSNKQTLVLEYLSTKFDSDKFYSENEVNDILNNHHNFLDPALLRRELYLKKFLDRELDGSKYWKIK